MVPLAEPEEGLDFTCRFLLYGYYIASAFVLRAMSPPLALMTAQETGLSGAFRHAHQRLVTNAEEVAFNDPPSGAAEQMILNQHLFRYIIFDMSGGGGLACRTGSNGGEGTSLSVIMSRKLVSHSRHWSM